MTALKATMPIHEATTTTTTTAWKNRSSRQQRISFTAFFLTCTAFIYILVLGTQFKMMSILGDHNDRTVASASNAAIGMDTGIGNNDLAMIVPPGHYHNLAELKRKATLTMRRKKNGDDGDGDGDGEIGRMGVVSHPRRHDKLAFEIRRQQALGMIANGVNDNGALLSPPEKNDHRPELDNESAQSNDDEATNTAPNNNENTNAQQHYQKSAASIAQKWNLTAFNSIFLLEQQFAKVNDYDPHNDFFHFHHLYKSGGTSISNLMDKTVGLPKSPPGEGGGKGYEGILPGSYESGNFDHDEALADIRRRLAAGTRREDLPYKASYAHTGLRPVYGPKRTATGEFLLEHLSPEKRLRVVTMLRDPTDFRASNHAMIMCGLNYEVSRFNSERRERGLLSQVCTPREGLNVSALVDRKISDLMEKCRKADEMERRGEKVTTLHNALRYQCRREKNGVDTREYCRSAGHLLASKEYDKHYRSMFKGLMGRFHRGQEFTNSTAYGRMGYGFERAENSHGYSVENVEEYTLQDLGGLDTKTISGAGDGVGHPPEPDFIWFGITERMKESTTLFYYYFKAKPLAKTPDSRVQPCRPTSWWSKEDREEVRRREPADYAVWRAANAIMDVRMEKMRVEIQAALDAGETKESLYYVDWDQLEEIGYKLENQKLVMSK